MSDLVKRLRDPAEKYDMYLCLEAADEIERNRAAIAELVGALDYTARRLQADIDDGSRPDQWTMEDIVRKCTDVIAKYDNTTTKETK